MNVNEIIDRDKDKLLDKISELIKIPSVTGTKYAKEALQHVCNMGLEDGFKVEYTKSGKAAHIEIGDCSKDFIGILAHLDVVPVNVEKWTWEPFGGKIDEKYIYGRGAQDDKGPFMMSYFALKALLESGFKPIKGIRFILGTQEEGGDWSDIEEYFEQFEIPKMGFTPDAEFPLIYAEKGIIRINVLGKFDNFEGIEINGGTVVNSVPALVVVDGQEFKGAPAHAKDADKGDSAAHKALEYVGKNSSNEVLKLLADKFAFDPIGKNIGIDFSTEDEGPLTVNIGVINIDKIGNTTIKFDIRWPQGFSHDKIIEAFNETFNNTTLECVVASKTDPLYVDKESKLIKDLESAFREVTNSDIPLATTGGGTYAKTFPNCVAFGPLFEDDEQTLHQENERANIKNTIKATKIYAAAIRKLTV